MFEFADFDDAQDETEYTGYRIRNRTERIPDVSSALSTWKHETLESGKDTARRVAGFGFLNDHDCILGRSYCGFLPHTLVPLTLESVHE